MDGQDYPYLVDGWLEGAADGISPCGKKNGVVFAAKSWADQLSEGGINANRIALGTIFTGMITGIADQLGLDPLDAFENFNVNNMFNGERGHVTVDDISNMVDFLTSSDARMITGQAFPVDAAWVAS